MALRFSEVSFAYGTRRVLDGVTLEVPSNEVVVLTGGNGAGKTTLLKLAVRRRCAAPASARWRSCS
jgi:ABC-type cobalamin/Fe3+-siderophores transport system ATPase subunit